MRTLVPLALLAAVAACKAPRSRHAEAPNPLPHSGPDLCAESLAGEWHHQDDPSYRFRVEDHGESVIVHPYRADVKGGDPVVIELHRKPYHLEGVTRQTSTFTFDTDGGKITKDCVLEFMTRVVTCEPRHLKLEVEQSAGVDVNCKKIDPGSDVATHDWVRD